MSTWETPAELEAQAAANGYTPTRTDPPPHDDTAEAAIIGALLNSPLALEHTGPLQADAFYRPAHHHIYQATLDLHANGTRPDPVLVAGWLTDRQLLEQIGGQTVVDRLYIDAPPHSSIAPHVARVTHLHQLRRLATCGTDLRDAARTDNPARIAQIVERITDTFVPDPGRTQQIRDRLLTSDQVIDLPPPQPLLAGLLQRDSLAMLYGPAGLAKTFLAIDWSMHIGAGAWWQGREVDTGPVLYVAAEGVSGLGPRINAWRTHHRITQDQIVWYPGAINLTDPQWADALTQAVAHTQPALVIIDTYARCTLGADENSGRDTGQVISHLDDIRRAADTCVLLVHHTGKDLDRGARGHSALRGAVDTELELTGDRTHMVLRNPKQKNSTEADPIHLTLLDLAGSCVVVPAATLDPDDLPKSAATALIALEEIDDPAGIPLSWWKTAAELADRTFYRQRKHLVTAGLVTNIGAEKSPRYRCTHLLPEPS